MTKFYFFRKTWLAVLALATATVASAGVLTPQDALTRATLASQRVLKTTQAKQTLVYTENDKNAEPAVYVFNAEGNKGYTVVSADDATVALLGYADEGSFDFENAPENFKAWIAEYANQIQYARERGYEAAPVVSASPKTAIAPLITARWGQDAPFNNLCPESIKDGKTVTCKTGCVATAMAQVMNYHKFPEKGKGSVKYSPIQIKKETGTAVELSLDFSTVTFDWANVLDVYTSSATEVETTAVATLMKACGYSVEMDYGGSSSAASSSKMVSALVDNFGYDKGIYCYLRDFYLQEEWDDIIYNQLVEYGPVYYGGSDIEGSGHAFVCDGYRDGLYHINWGWSGANNGYFVLSALDPKVQVIGGSNEGFNFEQVVVGNVTKNQVTTTPSVNAVCTNFFVEQSSTTLGGTFSVPGRFFSFTYGGLTGTYYAKMVDTTTGATYYAKGNRSPSSQQIGDRFNGCIFTLPSSLPDGIYKVTPVISVGTEYIDVRVPYCKCRYAMMTVSGSNVAIECSGVPKLSATTPEMLLPKIYKSHYFGLQTTLTNNGELDYFGELYALLLDDEGHLAAATNEQIISLKKGETVDFRYVSQFTKGTTGKTYKLCLAIPSANPSEGYVHISPVINVQYEEQETPAAFHNGRATADIKFVNSEGVEYPKTFLMSATENPYCFRYEVDNKDDFYISYRAYIPSSVSSMPYTYPFKFFIYGSGSVDKDGRVTYGTKVDDMTTDVKFVEAVDDASLAPYFKDQFKTEACDYDTDYAFVFQYRKSDDSAYTFTTKNCARLFRFVVPSGINDVTTDDATVVATELYNLSGVKVSQDNITPGVYVVVKTYSNGVKKSEKAAIR